jgi:hypothetical protein
MKIFLICNLIVVISFISCQNYGVNSASSVRDDTTEAIKFAISQAFSRNKLPAINMLTQKYYFKDSILFATDSLPFRTLPDKLDSFKFKKLSREQICKMIINDSSRGEKPNFLYVRDFNKTDSVYSVSVNCISCLPFVGGGGCYVEFVKRKGSFYILHKGYSNYN